MRGAADAGVRLGGLAAPTTSCRYSGKWSAYLATNTWASRPAVAIPLSMIWAGTGAWVKVWHLAQASLSRVQLDALVLGLPWQRIGEGGIITLV